MNDLRPGGAGENLTEFGEWLTLLTHLLDTNPTQIAKRAQVGRATVTELIRKRPDGRSVRPDPETLEKLWIAIQQIALERSGHALSDGYRQGFWTAGKRSSLGEEELAQARMRLQELTLFVTLKTQKDNLIVELRRENNVLSKQSRRRKRRSK